MGDKKTMVIRSGWRWPDFRLRDCALMGLGEGWDRQ